MFFRQILYVAYIENTIECTNAIKIDKFYKKIRKFVLFLT